MAFRPYPKPTPKPKSDEPYWIPKKSKKRIAQEKEYSKIRVSFLKENPICQVCGKKNSTEVHHTNERHNERLLNVEYFLAVDRDCHMHIHENPKWATEKGYLV